MNDPAEYDDEELSLFLKGLRRYITARALLIYIFIGGATVAFGLIYYYSLYLLLPSIHRDYFFILIMIGFIVGLNVVFQRSLFIHHLPPYTLDIIKKAGFKIHPFKHLLFFNRAKVYPTRNTYIRIGLIVGYLPFFELRFKSYKISLQSGKLAEKSDLLGTHIVRKIAEKNLIGWDEKSDSKRVGLTRKKMGGLRFKTICLPEEMTGRLLQMGKAIREWEKSLEKIAEYAVSN
ncbi:MAG: hypothetical protein HWN65_02100 [Candidatus Helarchaeota archaeon]|nr:hypothetical protein [Candidatus Helarchaeota archaeon]